MNIIQKIYSGFAALVVVVTLIGGFLVYVGARSVAMSESLPSTPNGGRPPTI